MTDDPKTEPLHEWNRLARENAEKLLPLVKPGGFITCGAFLCLSCVFGLLSKMYALRCKIGIDIGAAVRKTFLEHLAKYKEEERKIEEGAKFWGITLQTGIRIERILGEFFSPLPKWVVWLASRQLKKNAGNPQIGYLPLIKNLHAQGMWAFLQALSFLAFLIAGFVYAAAI